MLKLKKASTTTLINTLSRIRNRYDHETTVRKLGILADITPRAIAAPHLIRRLHRALCFLVAFPDDAQIHAAARQALDSFHERVAALPTAGRHALHDSGVAGTTVHHEFSYETARWLAEHHHERVDINWTDYELPEKLDDILIHSIAHAEGQTFDDGEITTHEWIRQAKGRLKMTDLEWLLLQLHGRRRLRLVWSHLFDAAEIPLKWNLDESDASITRNRSPMARFAYRRKGMRRPNGDASSEIAKPLPGIQRTKRDLALRLVDVANAALATRHREVYAMRYANPEEVYLAPLGEGTQLAVIGVQPEHRLSLEANYGYLLLSNGVPIGYGGVSPLFHQANTGINIFEEFRGGEASALFVRMLQAFHTLFGSTRFIANPFQFGRDNPEAIQSGAFWFYYRIGFRPTTPEVARLAKAEYTRIGNRKGHRSSSATLRKLAWSDLHLTIRGARADHMFHENWLGVCSTGATDLIAARMCPTRSRSIAGIVHDVVVALGIRDLRSWPSEERRAFERLAPLLALLDDLEDWPPNQKRALVKLARAKGGTCERAYAELLQRHDRFRRGLERFCRKRQRPRT